MNQTCMIGGQTTLGADAMLWGCGLALLWRPPLDLGKGWGFPRYDVSQLGPMAGTQMAIDPNAPKVPRFITLGGEPYLIRYNSRLPMVVYAPKGVEVRYRVWTAESEMKGFEKG